MMNRTLPICQAANSYFRESCDFPTVSAMDDTRRRIAARIAELGLHYSDVSTRLGRNHAYMQQYLKRNIPRKFPPDLRVKLAAILNTDTGTLFGENDYSDKVMNFPLANDTIVVAEYDLGQLRGALRLQHVKPISSDWYIPASFLRGLGSAPENIVIVRIDGDAMTPTIHSGEPVFVDTESKDLTKPGVYILEDGETVFVRRVERVPGSSPQQVVLIADKPGSASFQVEVERLKALGRVVCAIRPII